MGDIAVETQGGVRHRRRWVIVAVAAVIAAAVVLAWGVLLGNATSANIGMDATSATRGPHGGQVVWAYQCPGSGGSPMDGVEMTSGTYLRFSDPKRDFDQQLPAGDKVQITEYWFRPSHVVYVAANGQHIVLHRIKRFLATGCAIAVGPAEPPTVPTPAK
jgi:hypothetical protein